MPLKRVKSPVTPSTKKLPNFKPKSNNSFLPKANNLKLKLPKSLSKKRKIFIMLRLN